MQNSAIRIALEAAIEAGHEILRIYNDPAQDFGIEKKADNSPLTLADKAAHACIVKHLTTMPYPILSEEGKHLPYEDRKAWKELWIVDPLDGTKEFIKKNGEFTVNIAFVRNGAPLFGVIYVPVKGDLYWGINNETPKAYKAQINPQEKAKTISFDLSSCAASLPSNSRRCDYSTETLINAARSDPSKVEMEFVLSRLCPGIKRKII
jgi:3'(2'),5'-bisphosphate nucleotidase